MSEAKPILLAGLIAFLLFPAIISAAAEPPLAYGSTTTPAVATSAIAPLRKALVIAPASLIGGAGLRNAVAQADASRYRETLCLLGFDVTMVVAETRPDLELGVRGFARQLSTGTDVVVFALGGIIPSANELYLFGSGTTPQPETYATEGLSLSSVLRQISDHAPKEIIVVVDECRNEDGQICQLAGALDGVSAIIGTRISANASGVPLAGLISLRADLVPLMQQEGLTFLGLFGNLKGKLAGTNMSVGNTPSLSRSFAFLPTGFFAQLPDACNRLQVNATADQLTGAPSVEPIVNACTKAAETYAHWDFFKDKLALAREQLAFQKAAAGCDSEPAIRAYLSDYPTGRFTSVVTAAKETCDGRRRAKETQVVPLPASQPAELASTTCTIGGLDPAGNNWLALRAQPNFQASWSTTRMGPGTVVTALGRDGEWIRVRLRSGEIGWANGHFVRCDGQTPPPKHSSSVCTVGGLDPNGDNWLALRPSPAMGKTWSSTHMSPGTRLTLLGSSGPWRHVRLDSGEEGWSYGKYVFCPE